MNLDKNYENSKFIDDELLPSILFLNKLDLSNEEEMNDDKEMEEFLKIIILLIFFELLV